MNREEWELMCDRCGRCCLNKVNGPNRTVVYTRIACYLLNPETRQCSNYQRRWKFCPDCKSLSPNYVPNWLPDTCAYRRWKDGKAKASVKEIERKYPWKDIVSEARVGRYRKGYELCIQSETRWLGLVTNSVSFVATPTPHGQSQI